MNQRQRRGEPVPDEAAFVVSADLRDPDVLTDSAQANRAIYGFYGISVFAEVGGITWEEIATAKLRRADWLVLFTARALLAIASTCGTPVWHRTTTSSTMMSTSSWGVFLGCEHRVVKNPLRGERAPS